MKSFFQKHGKEIIFAVIIIICIFFLVELIAVGRGYSAGVTQQAMERAEFYSAEQQLLLDAHLNDYKANVEYFASRLALCTKEEDAIALIREAKSASEGAYEELKEVYYLKDSVLYDWDGVACEGYPELSGLAAASGTVISRVFQYDNIMMAVGISAPAENPYMDRIVFVFDKSILLFPDSMRGAESSIPAMGKTEFSLLCKHDGKIIDRQVNSSLVEIGEESVFDGVFRRILPRSDTYRQVTAMIRSTSSGSVTLRIGTEEYILTVNSLGTEEGGVFLLNLYQMRSVYSEGYELMQNLWGALLVFAVIIIFISVVFMVGEVQTRRKIYTLAMMHESIGCPTLRKFERDTEAILRQNRATRFAMVIAHINRFNYIGECFGETVENEFLIYAKNAYQNGMVLSETIGYSSGGEFYLLLHYKDKKVLTDRLNGMYQNLTRYATFQEADYKVNVSFSIYEVEAEETSVHRMIDKVGMVRNMFMNQGASVSFHFYGDLLRKNYIRRSEIEGRMENALKNCEFHLFYQPKYNFRTRSIDGSEILVRWFDPKIEAYRKPAEFLPVFEETGFINKMDRFVFYRACENIAQRVSERQTVYPVSVNVSRVTATQPDFVEYYGRIKSKFGIPDRFITLEFTESFAYENYEYLSDIITQLHNTGFLCSLDDFGTGYSSYNTLKTLDMDEIKLDKFFLVEGVSKERDQLLLKSVIDLVHELHIKVTQEGVETREDFDRLSAMGCDVIQGYYFSKPMKYVTYCKFVKENFEK